jgi:phage tail sheath gpL-like
MTISFDSIPTTIRVPFTAVEFNSSRAQQGPALLAYKGLIIGQKLASGTWAADSVQRATNVDQAIVGGGRGSMIHQQALAWFAVNRSTELWFGVLADNGAGVAAAGTIVVTGPATAAGTIALYVGGQRITTAVASGDISTAIATNIAASVNANSDLIVTAAAVGSTITFTYRHKGLVGNAYDLRVNYRDGEALPAGVSFVITAVGTATAGTTNPTLTNLIAAMGDMWFQVWSHPYTDATSLTAIETDLSSRFGPLRSMDGIAITSAIGSFATLSALGLTRNSQHSVILAQPGATPLTPPVEFAAEAAALIAFYGAADPARPFQTLAMSRALPVVETDQWSIDERNLLLYAGIATTKRVAGGVTQLERIITTYRTSPSGALDTSYLDATTMLTLLYLRYSFRVRVQNRYPRHKLADDGTRFGSGQAVMTPKLGKAEAVTWFREMEELGLVEGFDQFKRDLVCERNATDPNRLDWLLPPDLINQLIVTAAQIQFRL